MGVQIIKNHDDFLDLWVELIGDDSHHFSPFNPSALTGDLDVSLSSQWLKEHKQVCYAVSLTVRSSETVKALIAGFTGRTHYEFLDWGLKLAETAFQNCSQCRKFIVVLYDGDPVYEGAEGNDLTLSHTHIRRLERAGITVIGIYLGDDSELVTKLKRLFPRLIVCSNNDLPDKLGNLLKSLA